MNIVLNEDGTSLTAEVTIKERKMAVEKNRTFNTKNLLDYLEENGYNLDEWNLLQKDFCSTNGRNQKLNGTWVLRKKEKNESRSTKSSKQSRSTRRSTRKENQLLGTKNMGGVQSQAQTDLPGQDQKVSG